MIEFGCNGTSKFINSIYDFLADEKICFLSGSIVIDDDAGKLFNSLYKGNQSSLHSHKCDNTNESRRVGMFGTHAAFITDKRFKTARRDQVTSFTLDAFDSAIQFEKILEPKLTYLCNKSCAVKKCNETEKFPKGVALFYPFQIYDTGRSDPQKFRFIFIKLEEFEYDNPAHMGKAWDRYVRKREKGDSYPKKREDPSNGEINRELVEKDKWNMVEFVRTYNSEALSKVVHDKIDFYNVYVRVGNETYIPSELILLLHVTTIPEDQIIEAQLEGKKYKDNSTKMEDNCVDSKWTHDQLYFMAKVMKLPVSKNMTKLQLCNHLTTYRQSAGILTAMLRSVRKKLRDRSTMQEDVGSPGSPMTGFLRNREVSRLGTPKKLFVDAQEEYV